METPRAKPNTTRPQAPPSFCSVYAEYILKSWVEPGDEASHPSSLRARAYTSMVKVQAVLFYLQSYFS